MADLYTLVRHTGYDRGGKPDFAHAVEMRSITARQAARIKKIGGMVFDDYFSADEAEMAENYPPEVEGLIPRARGTFSGTVLIDGSPLYIPARVREEA